MFDMTNMAAVKEKIATVNMTVVHFVYPKSSFFKLTSNKIKIGRFSSKNFSFIIF